jgi:Spy/CpxP family protein refolding chaperone
MQRPIFSCTALAVLAAGIAFAQVPGGNSQPDAPTTKQGRQDITSSHLEKLAQVFDLTDSQKETARTIFEQVEQSAQPVRQESQQNLDELIAAAKAGKNEGEIQKLAQEQGRLLGQLLAIRTVAWAKFYRMLTPEQRAKAEPMNEQFKQKAPSGEPKNGP